MSEPEKLNESGGQAPKAKAKSAAKSKPKSAAKAKPKPDRDKQTKPQDEISKQSERGMQVPKEGPDPDRDTKSPEDADQPSVTEKMTSPDVLSHEPKHLPLEHAGFDHYAAEERRQRELAAAREEHNRRTGDASRR